MDISKLRYFQKVAQLEHMTKAAQELMVAQPAVSKTIHQLEEEFGCKLFERNGRNIRLNRQGKKLLYHTNQLFNDLDLLYADMKGEQEVFNNSLSLSVQVASEMLPDMIQQFKQQYPEANISIVQFEPDADDNLADISIYATAAPVSNPWAQTVMEEPIYLATPPGHPLSAQDTIALGDLEHEVFIGLRQGASLSDIVGYYCNIAGFTPNVVLRCDSPYTLRQFILLGLGMAFVPANTWRSITESSIVLHPLVQPECKRYINVRWKKRGVVTPIAAAFRELAFEFFRTLDQQPHTTPLP